VFSLLRLWALGMRVSNSIWCRHCFAYGHIEQHCQKKKLTAICRSWPKESHESVPMNEAITSNTPPPMPSDRPCLPGNRAEEQGAHSPHHNHNCHSTISPSSHTSSPRTSFQREINQAMANFPVDPLPFILPGIDIDD
jgi:hypothetical protein